MEIYATPNKDRNGFTVVNNYQRGQFFEWLKKYDSFKIEPVIQESSNRRRYLEGAVIPCYCKWQYAIDPREPGKADQRRVLFMRDFNSDIVTNRNGDPERVPLSSKGEVSNILNTYTRYAEENGAPIPNPELYKKWRDEYGMDIRFKDFYSWLEFLGIEEDAMPSAETFNKLI